MFSAVANSERLARVLPLAVLLAAVGLVRPWEAALRETVSPPSDAPGSVSALLPDSWRMAAANACWLRTNLAWERRDAAATRLLLELTVATDERSLGFWLNGARMIAHDFPVWREQPGMPEAVRARLRREEAEQALAWLERALVRHPAKAAIYLEMADIRWRSLGERAEAARLFRLAAEQPGAPWHAARIHAELLCELGRPDEALAWLRQVWPTLPADEPAARRDVVRRRIEELERMLGAPGPRGPDAL